AASRRAASRSASATVTLPRPGGGIGIPTATTAIAGPTINALRTIPVAAAGCSAGGEAHAALQARRVGLASVAICSARPRPLPHFHFCVLGVCLPIGIVHLAGGMSRKIRTASARALAFGVGSPAVPPSLSSPFSCPLL